MRQNYDAIITGAGPAGLSTAEFLSNNTDYNILLVEKENIGETEHCWSAWADHLEKFNLEDCISTKTDFFTFETFLGTRIEIPSNLSSVNEKKLLLRLKERLDNNCDILENCSFEKFFRSKNEDKLFVETSKGIFSTKLLIDATGVNGPIVRHFKLQKNKLFWQNLIYVIEDTKIRTDEFILLDFAFPNEPKPVFWLGPYNENKIFIGVFYLVEKEISENEAKKDLEKYILKKNIRGKKTKVIKGNIPLFDNQKNYFDNILLVGDSAAQPNAITGCGLNRALQNGQVAGSIAKKSLDISRHNSKFLKNYNNHIKKLYKVEYMSAIIPKMLIYYSKYDHLEKYLKANKKIPKNILNIGIRSELDIPTLQKTLFFIIKDFNLLTIFTACPTRKWPFIIHRINVLLFNFIKETFNEKKYQFFSLITILSIRLSLKLKKREYEKI